MHFDLLFIRRKAKKRKNKNNKEKVFIILFVKQVNNQNEAVHCILGQ
jgi:hypothetical protein